jgi:hypothetical protein
MKRRRGDELRLFASSPPIVKRQIPDLKHALGLLHETGRT